MECKRVATKGTEAGYSRQGRKRRHGEVPANDSRAEVTPTEEESESTTIATKPRPDSWRLLLMHALAKVSRAKVIKDYRFIALRPTLSKWYMKALLLVLRRIVGTIFQRRGVFSRGFGKGRSTRSVVT